VLKSPDCGLHGHPARAAPCDFGDDQEAPEALGGSAVPTALQRGDGPCRDTWYLSRGQPTVRPRSRPICDEPERRRAWMAQVIAWIPAEHLRGSQRRRAERQRRGNPAATRRSSPDTASGWRQSAPQSRRPESSPFAWPYGRPDRPLRSTIVCLRVPVGSALGRRLRKCTLEFFV
jgi:hypothetical protein